MTPKGLPLGDQLDNGYCNQLELMFFLKAPDESPSGSSRMQDNETLDTSVTAESEADRPSAKCNEKRKPRLEPHDSENGKG